MSASPIVLPDMPAVEGLCFRSIHGEADAYALYGVHAGRATRDGIDPLSPFEECLSRESIRLALAKAVATWQHDQWLVSQVGEHVIGYSRINSWCEEDGRWVYLISGYVLPEWRGRGIGTAMQHWGEQTARRLAASQHPNEKFEFAANASSTEQDATALLLHDGYCLGYTMLDMRLDASTPLSVYALPPGLEVRLACQSISPSS